MQKSQLSRSKKTLILKYRRYTDTRQDAVNFSKTEIFTLKGMRNDQNVACLRHRTYLSDPLRERERLRRITQTSEHTQKTQ